jgi:tRNA(Ile)-lysidine synthetase-like protein
MRARLNSQGIYIVAVSGGVDSMVLLELLNKEKQSGVSLIVAHLDHGIRADSHMDKQLVMETAKNYKLPFFYKEASLGSKTSEAHAREVRYEFLESVMKTNKAVGIITAHHQDDVIETAIINILRGSNRRGLTSINNGQRIRPLLNYPKSEIIKYAKSNNIIWREDSTNLDTNYMRNYVRHEIVPKLNLTARSQLIEIINKLSGINNELDELITKIIQKQPTKGELNRTWFNSLPHNVSKEVLASWLRQYEIRSYDKITLERLSVSAKVARSGQIFPIKDKRTLKVKHNNLALSYIER